MTAYIDFPVDALEVETGTLTWIAEYQGDPVSMAAIEVPVKYFTLPQFSESDDEFSDPHHGTTLHIELAMPQQPLSSLANFTYEPDNSCEGKSGGSIYLQQRHHGVEVKRVQFGTPNGSTIPITANLDLIFSDSGLFAGENVEFYNADWTFHTVVETQDRVHILMQPRRWSRHWIAHKLQRVFQKYT
jgi:hypothetical protein